MRIDFNWTAKEAGYSIEPSGPVCDSINKIKNKTSDKRADAALKRNTHKIGLNSSSSFFFVPV